jgi:hypothetical protein
MTGGDLGPQPPQYGGQPQTSMGPEPPAEPGPHPMTPQQGAAPYGFRPRRTGILVAGVIGLVIGALVASGIWLLANSGGGGPAGSGPPVPPAKLGEYARIGDLRLSQSGLGKQNADRVSGWNQHSAERLSATYGGAAAAAETYYDEGMRTQFALYLVRTRAPFPPFVPFQDSAYLQVKRPFEEMRQFGDVACMVRNDPVPTNGEDRADTTHVVTCLRTSDHFTVQIAYVTDDLGNNPQQVADLVNQAWAAAA